MMSESRTTHLCIAYVLRRFPVLSQTFVTQEIIELRRAGVRVLVFSLLMPKEDTISQSSIDACYKDVYYAPFTFFAILWAQMEALWHAPGRFLYSLVNSLFEHKPNLSDYIKALVIFPKCVYFGHICQKAGVSHVHAHWPGLATLGAEIIATTCEVPFSFSVHTINDIKYVGLAQQVNQARAVRVNSRYNLRLLIKRFPKLAYKLKMIRSILIPNDVCLKEEDCQDIRCHILAVGRLIEKKGFQYLIRACSILRDRELQFQCTLLGDGPLLDSLTDLTKELALLESISFVGAVPHEQVWKYIAGCDMLVAPCVTAQNGREDGLPTVILEVMSVGKPVIATPVAGISEIVINGETGFIVPQQNFALLADAIEILLASPEIVAFLGRNADELIATEFDNNKTVQAMIDMFNT